MDGSTASLIAIPIVATLVLAAWLLLVAYAAAHPRWKHGTAAAGPENPAPADHQIHPAEPAAPICPWPTLAGTPSRKSPPS
jgi:hypothetical protein